MLKRPTARRALTLSCTSQPITGMKTLLRTRVLSFMLLCLLCMGVRYGAAQDLSIGLTGLQDTGPLNWADDNWFLRGIVIDAGAVPLGALSNELNFTTVSQFPRVDPMPPSDISDGNFIRWYRKTGSTINVGDVAGVEFFDLMCPSGTVCTQSGTIPVALGNNLAWAPETGGVLGGPLPVELVGFDALVSDGDVLLSWQTASETDNAGFHIEHKQGHRFVDAGFVEGAGTTAEAQTYAFRIPDPEPGRHTFRLKQLDLNGAFEYSAEVEVTVDVPGTHHLGAAYPNPLGLDVAASSLARFGLILARAQHVKVELFNALGQKVALVHDGILPAQQTHTFTIEGTDQPTGLYLYRVTGETFSQSKTLTILR